LAGGAKGI